MFEEFSIVRKNQELYKTKKFATLDAVGILYSSHTDLESRKFVSKLLKYYKLLNKGKKDEEKGEEKKKKRKKLEVIYVSADKKEQFYVNATKSSPWLSVTYDQTPKFIEMLVEKYSLNINVTPTFMLLNPRTQKFIRKSAVDQILNDPEGLGFPYRVNLKQLITETEYEIEEKTCKLNVKDGMHYGFYFGDINCTNNAISLVPIFQKCQNLGIFTPIIIPMDKRKFEFKKWRNNCPTWYAFPHGETEKRKDLAEVCEVSVFPTLVIMNSSFKVINKNAFMAAIKDEDFKNFPWGS